MVRKNTKQEEENDRQLNDQEAVNKEGKNSDTGHGDETGTSAETEEELPYTTGEKEKEKEEKDTGTDNNETEEKDTEAKLAELQDRYLRLSAEFDNYRRRTLKERMEMTRSAGQDILVGLLPVMDDFDRAVSLMEVSPECKAIKDGVDLIYGKMKEFLKKNGVKEIDALDKDFDTDLHEAITKIPATDKKKKGKVVDVIQKGYYLNDKIIRYSKVVVGE